MAVFPRKRKYPKKFLVAAVLLVLLLLSLNFFQKNIRGFFYGLSSPVQRFLWKAGNGSSNFLISFLKAGSLKKENEELKSENEALLSQIAFLRSLKTENESLRQALNIELQKDFTLTIANIIGKDIGQDFILIDKGAKDGLSQNTPVVTSQKVLLGKVVEVYKSSSKVMLVSNKKSSFDAKIQDKDVSGVAKGEGNFKIILDLVPRDKEVSGGDLIATTNLGGIFPAGILVGKVKDPKKNDVDPFWQIEIEPAFDINKIDSLFLIVNK